MPGVGGSILNGASMGFTMGSAVPGIGTAVGGVIGAAGGLLAGLSQKKKAKDLLSNLKYPTYTTPSEILTNQKLARQRANVGLPSEQYKQGQQNIQRQQSAAIKGAQDRRQGQAAVATANQVATDAQLNLDVANGQARVQNERGVLAANKEVANYKDTAWAWNTQNKYNRDYNYAMSLKGYGNQNMMAGIDSLGAAATGLPWEDWLAKKPAAPTGSNFNLVSNWNVKPR